MAVSAILDHNGHPFQHLNGDASRLKNTGFALSNVSTFSGLVQAVSKTYRWAFDEALRTSPNDALAMRRDGAIMAMLRERQMPTAQAKWHLEPEDQTDEQQNWIAEQLTHMVAAIPRFSRFRLQLLEAIWFGRYANQFAIGKRIIRGQTRYSIFNHQPVHGDKLIYRWDGTPGVLITQLYSHKYQESGLVGVTQPYVERLKAQGAVVLPTERGLALFLETPQWRERFAVHMHESEDADFMEPQLAGGVYGVGLRTRLFWLWWLRNEVLSSLLDYLQRVGAGGLTLIGYEQSNDASKEAALAIGEQLEAGNVILVPKPVGTEKLTSTVERVEPSESGSKTLIDMVNNFFDKWMERAIVGQSMSSGSDGEGSLGGSGRASFAENTKSQLIRMDADALDECITEQVVQPLKRWNFPSCQFKVFFKTDLTKPEPEKLLEAAQKVWEMGAELKTDEVMEIAGLSMPQPGDETLSKAASEPQMGGMPGEMGGAPGEGMPAGEEEGGDETDQQFQQAVDSGDLFSQEGLAKLQAQMGGNGNGDSVKKYARWKEREHPRDNDGKFSSKPSAAWEKLIEERMPLHEPTAETGDWMRKSIIEDSDWTEPTNDEVFERAKKLYEHPDSFDREEIVEAAKNAVDVAIDELTDEAINRSAHRREREHEEKHIANETVKQETVKAIESALGISSFRQAAGGSWYGEYKGLKLRVSDHKQKAGGGWSEGKGGRMGESDVEWVVEIDGKLPTREDILEKIKSADAYEEDELDQVDGGEEPFRQAQASHAPKGYTNARPLVINGKKFTGGMFIPNEDMAHATPEQKAEIEGEGIAEDAKKDAELDLKGVKWESSNKETASKLEEQWNKLQDEWAELNNQLLAEGVDNADSEAVKELIDRQRQITLELDKLPMDKEGLPAEIGQDGPVRDMIVIGAGPAGLSAGINAGAEGLNALVIEAQAIQGGQAKWSSRIENYAGFPAGVSGEKLMGMMKTQAERMRAKFEMGQGVKSLTYDPETGLKTVELKDGRKFQGRSVVIAGGLEFRKANFPGADSEKVLLADGKKLAELTKGKTAVVVGGSNAAAQAALGAALGAEQVYIMSRHPIEKLMSDYQRRQVKQLSKEGHEDDAETLWGKVGSNPKIKVIVGDEVAKFENDMVTTKNGETIPAAGVGLFIGSAPNTSWLPEDTELAQGKIYTNDNYEVPNIPGVYAVGDIGSRGGGRIGVAVGQGQHAVANAFKYFESGLKKEAKVKKTDKGYEFSAKTPEEAMASMDELEAMSARFKRKLKAAMEKKDKPEMEKMIFEIKNVGKEIEKAMTMVQEGMGGSEE